MQLGRLVSPCLISSRLVSLSLSRLLQIDSGPIAFSEGERTKTSDLFFNYIAAVFLRAAWRFLAVYP